MTRPNGSMGSTRAGDVLRIDASGPGGVEMTEQLGFVHGRRGSKITGKNEPLRSFGIRSCTSPAWVASSRGPGPVAVGETRFGALVAVGADPLTRLGFDQLLQHQPYRFAD